MPFSKSFILIPVCITVSKAFWKSTKQANTLPSLLLQYLSIMVFRINMWSDVLAFFVNPIWLSLITWCLSRNLVNWLSRILINNLPREFVIVIPLLLFGSDGSFPLWIGVIYPCVQFSG